jgi:hypothetical protein
MSGLRRTGSSLGKGACTIPAREPTMSRTRVASSAEEAFSRFFRFSRLQRREKRRQRDNDLGKRGRTAFDRHFAEYGRFALL